MIISFPISYHKIIIKSSFYLSHYGKFVKILSIHFQREKKIIQPCNNTSPWRFGKQLSRVDCIVAGRALHPGFTTQQDRPGSDFVNTMERMQTVKSRFENEQPASQPGQAPNWLLHQVPTYFVSLCMFDNTRNSITCLQCDLPHILLGFLNFSHNFFLLLGINMYQYSHPINCELQTKFSLQI